VPLEIDGGLHVTDEGVRADATLEGIGSVKLLKEGGSSPAANASQNLRWRVRRAGRVGARAEAIRPHADGAPSSNHDRHRRRSVIMLEEPIPATRKALARAGMTIDDIDLYEVNEAFAPVPLAWLQAIGADPAKLNVNGGAIALGHPLGASGTKLMATLIHALKARGKRYGLQTMCEGGGIANVTIVEAL